MLQQSEIDTDGISEKVVNAIVKNFKKQGDNPLVISEFIRELLEKIYPIITIQEYNNIEIVLTKIIKEKRDEENKLKGKKSNSRITTLRSELPSYL